MKKFNLTSDLIKLVCRFYVDHYGRDIAPSISKSPYGNSNIEKDIAEILGWKLPNDSLSDKQAQRAWALHDQTWMALQIILATKSFVPGVYIRTDKYDVRSWQLSQKKQPTFEASKRVSTAHGFIKRKK